MTVNGNHYSTDFLILTTNQEYTPCVNGGQPLISSLFSKNFVTVGFSFLTRSCGLC